LATKNKPEQTEKKAEKLLKTRSCGKNKAKTNRAMLLKIKDREKTNRKLTGAFREARLLVGSATAFRPDILTSGSNSIVTTLLLHPWDLNVLGS
jgi:hypothetical protein